MDEWKMTDTSTTIKESKLEKLEVLIRILKNTTDIDTYYPKKKKLIIW
jgi:rapamycin-insensitive companion of mTOR